MYLGAGLLAAVAAGFFLQLVGQSGSRVIIVLVAPVMEEIAKTGAALLFNTSVFLTHLVFGVAELAADSRRGRGIWPGLAALVLHGVLGLITAWLYRVYASPPVALAAATVLHVFWNHAAVALLGPGGRLAK